MDINMLLALCLIVGYLINPTLCGSGSDKLSLSGDVVDGEALVKMGRKAKQPLLTLIGMAIRNLHQCAEWTRWSMCTAGHPGYFGTMNRTRICKERDLNDTITAKIQEDARICEGVCPSGYNWTGNDLCLKLYNVQKSLDDAEKLCQSDGGHLVFIDTEQKFNDVKKMMEGFGGYAWIDGRRKDVSSPWKNVYGETMKKFFWLSSQPNNGSLELCLVLTSANSREWHDATCTATYFPLCEILQ